MSDTEHKIYLASTLSQQTAILASEYVVARLGLWMIEALGCDASIIRYRVGYEYSNGNWNLGLWRDAGHPRFSDAEVQRTKDALQGFIAGRGEGWV